MVATCRDKWLEKFNAAPPVLVALARAGLDELFLTNLKTQHSKCTPMYTSLSPHGELSENQEDTKDVQKHGRLKNISLAVLVFGAFFAFFGFLLDENYYLDLKIKNVVSKSESRPVSQLFYDTGSGWNEANSTNAKVKRGFHIGLFNELSFRLPTKKIDRFRVDVRNEAFHVQIRDVKITKKTFFGLRDVELTSFPLENFGSYNEDILTHEIQGDTLTIQTKSTVRDPYFVLTPAKPVLLQKTFLSQSAWWLSGILSALATLLCFRFRQFIFRAFQRIDLSLLKTNDSTSGTMLFKLMMGALVGVCLLSIPYRIRFAPLSVFIIPAIIYVLVAFFFAYPLLKEFLSKVEARKLFVFAFAVAVAAYWQELTNFTLSIDEELNLFGSDLETYVTEHRWGRGIFRFIFPVTFGSLPFLPTALFCVGLSLAGAILATTFSVEKKWQFLFCALFVSAPNWPHLAQCSAVSASSGLGLVFASLAVRQYYFSRRPAALISAFILFVLSLGDYQAFFFYFFVALLFLILFSEEKPDEISLKKIKAKGISILRLVLFCGFAVGVSSGISKLLHLWTNIPATDRISGMFNLFDTGDLFSRLKFTINSMRFTLLGMENLFLGQGMSSLFIFWVGLLVIFFYEPLKIRAFLYKGVSLLCVICVAFALVFITYALLFRTLFAFAILYAFIGACAAKAKSNFVMIIAAVGVLTNIYICTANFNNDAIARERDKVFANSLISEMRLVEPKLGKQKVRFAVIGPHKHEDLVFTPKHQIFGRSFFGWYDGESVRVSPYLRYLGVTNLEAVDLSDADFARLNDEKYPIFPEKGSVFYYNNVLVVKLGKTTRNSKTPRVLLSIQKNALP
ncbi:MAG: glucosyltransferase domain-containing protein [Puniceicoccales bacterium]|jgi:hypothetical protein|nr:glucosyltransferase domain-containing protein [Puniceicoccales bacterium]